MFSAAPPTAAGVTSVTNEPASWARTSGPNFSPAGHVTRQRPGRAEIGHRGQHQRQRGPAPVGGLQRAEQAHPPELAEQQVPGDQAGDQGHHRAGPDPLQPDRRRILAGSDVEKLLAQRGQDVPAAAHGDPGGAVQHDRLEQRHHPDQLVGTDRLGREPGRAVRPDQQGQLGQQLRHVEAELEVGGGHITVAGIKQDDVAIAGEHDAVRGQGPVRDAVGMQLQDGLPYPQQLVIGRR